MDSNLSVNNMSISTWNMETIFLAQTVS